MPPRGTSEPSIFKPKGDVFEMLIYIALAVPPSPVPSAWSSTGQKFFPDIMKVSAFIDFVLAQCVVQRVKELDPGETGPSVGASILYAARCYRGGWRGPDDPVGFVEFQQYLFRASQIVSNHITGSRLVLFLGRWVDHQGVPGALKVLTGTH